MSVNYKPLCEVKLLHEYYLTARDGTTVFDLPVQADRLSFLKERFRFRYPSINEHLAFEPATAVGSLFSNYRLRVIESYSGFKLFTSVTEEMLPGGIKAYKPLFSIPENFPLLIQLRNKNFFLDTISNSSFKKPLRSKYYFTNRNLGAPRIFPSLTRSLSLRDDTLQYEQGELVFDPGDNQTKAFFTEKDGTINWMAVSGSGYAGNNDLSLLPARFQYHFSNADEVNEATFILKDAANAVVSTINRSSVELLTKVTVDFSSVVPRLLNTDIADTPEQYILEVTSTNGYSKTHPVTFCSNDLFPFDNWGLVHLQTRVADPAFNLIDDEGFLITRKNAGGSILPAPVFVIRIKSRFAFWRYLNNRNIKILDNPALHPFLSYDAANGIMETKKMINASYTPVELNEMGATQYLPNPDPSNPLTTELQRVYTDIRVPQSDLFKI